MSAITISNLRKTYRTKRWGVVEALKGIDLSIAAGEVFGFLGPNGAGKSTTIKILTGLITASGGSAAILGSPVPSVESRKQIGYLPENPAFYDFLSASEYLRLVAGIFKMSKAAAERESERVLRLLDLWDARRRPIRSYSKGMVQRLGLAQVLLPDPSVLILDEPMSGLDPLGRALVKEILLQLKSQGKTIFFSTHITADVETVCDRVGIIVGGTLQTVELVRTILEEGITGYLIRAEREKETLELRADPAHLARTLAEVEQNGWQVLLVEPLRRNLEEFFLSIVQGKRC